MVLFKCDVCGMISESLEDISSFEYSHFSKLFDWEKGKYHYKKENKCYQHVCDKCKSKISEKIQEAIEEIKGSEE